VGIRAATLGWGAALALAAPYGSLSDLPGPSGCAAEQQVLYGIDDGCTVVRAGARHVHHVALSPDQRNVYTAAGTVPLPPDDHGAIGVFARDGRTGGVTQLGCLKRPGTPEGDQGCAVGRALGGMRFVVVSPDGRNLYAAGAGGIAVFRRDASTGALTQLRGRSGCLNSRGAEGCGTARATTMATVRPRLARSLMEHVRLTRDGRWAYASNSSGSVTVYRRDPATGRLRQLRGRLGCLVSRASRLDNRRRCGTARSIERPRSVELSPDERFAYVSSIEDSVAIFRRNARTGELTQLRGRNGCLDEHARGGCARARGLLGPHLVTLTANGRFAYVAGKKSLPQDSSIAIFRRDPRTGTLRQLAGSDGCITQIGVTVHDCAQARMIAGAHAIALDRAERTAYLSSDTEAGGIGVFRRDRRTGALQQLPGPPGCISDGRFGADCGRGRRAGGIHFAEISRDGRFVYAAGEASQALIVLQRAQ
jgi:6-phosphogluconolactonase (cycloisomerase 2 family)